MATKTLTQTHRTMPACTSRWRRLCLSVTKGNRRAAAANLEQTAVKPTVLPPLVADGVLTGKVPLSISNCAVSPPPVSRTQRV